MKLKYKNLKFNFALKIVFFWEFEATKAPAIYIPKRTDGSEKGFF